MRQAYIIIDGQHRWASAYLAACHHICYSYYILYIFKQIKIVVVIVVIVVLLLFLLFVGATSSKNPNVQSFQLGSG